MDAMLEVSGKLGLPDQDLFGRIIAMPDVLCVEEGEEDQAAVRALLAQAMDEAFQQIVTMRLAEGNRLCADLICKLDCLAALVERISERAPRVVEEYRTKLHRRLADLLNGEIDEARFQTEVAVFADRAAIDEELVRLRSHIAHIREIAATPEPAGRKLDFLAQELNREVNTIGSKALDGEIATLVISAKGEIEKIREQVQNIE